MGKLKNEGQYAVYLRQKMFIRNIRKELFGPCDIRLVSFWREMCF